VSGSLMPSDKPSQGGKTQKRPKRLCLRKEDNQANSVSYLSRPLQGVGSIGEDGLEKSYRG